MQPLQPGQLIKVWLSRRAVDRIQSDACKYFPLETGGVLLGWRKGNDRIIVDVIGAGPNALHGQTRFLPDHKWQMHHLAEAFRKSDGDLDYLGDWHTHPNGVAQLSDMDRGTLRRISRTVADPLMLIAAGDPSAGWTMAAWLQHKARWITAPSARDCHLQIFDPPSHWPTYVADDPQP